MSTLCDNDLYIGFEQNNFYYIALKLQIYFSSKFFMVLIDTSRGLRQQIAFAVYLSLLRPKTETETTINFIFIMGAWKVPIIKGNLTKLG